MISQSFPGEFGEIFMVTDNKWRAMQKILETLDRASW